MDHGGLWGRQAQGGRHARGRGDASRRGRAVDGCLVQLTRERADARTPPRSSPWYLLSSSSHSVLVFRARRGRERGNDIAVVMNRPGSSGSDARSSLCPSVRLGRPEARAEASVIARDPPRGAMPLQDSESCRVNRRWMEKFFIKPSV